MAIKTYVESAWEHNADLKTNEIDGARESADCAKIYEDGAWEDVWKSYTPIIKDGEWCTSAYYGEVTDIGDTGDYAWGSLDNTSLVYGQGSAEEDGDGDIGWFLEVHWTIPLEAVPTAIYIEGWIDDGFGSGFIEVGGISSKYELGTDTLGNVAYNQGEWIEFESLNTNYLYLTITGNAWYSNTSVDYDYYSKVNLPLWKIKNLWVKF